MLFCGAVCVAFSCFTMCRVKWAAMWSLDLKAFLRKCVVFTVKTWVGLKILPVQRHPALLLTAEYGWGRGTRRWPEPHSTPERAADRRDLGCAPKSKSQQRLVSELMDWTGRDTEVSYNARKVAVWFGAWGKILILQCSMEHSCFPLGFVSWFLFSYTKAASLLLTFLLWTETKNTDFF